MYREREREKESSVCGRPRFAHSLKLTGTHTERRRSSFYLVCSPFLAINAITLVTSGYSAMEAGGNLTEYERQRLENVKRNQAMLAALGVNQAANDLHSSGQLGKVEKRGYQKRSPEQPITIRRSLRAQGLSPDGEAILSIERELNNESPISEKKRRRRDSGSHFSRVFDTSFDPSTVEGPLAFSSVHLIRKRNPDALLLDRLKQLSDQAPLHDLKGRTCNTSRGRNIADAQLVDPSSLRLKGRDVARVVPDRIFCVAFFPLRNRIVLAVGGKSGALGLWDVDCDEEEGDGVHIYRPHGAPVTGIAIAPFSATKVLTCSYDGQLRLMDVESAQFDLPYRSHDILSTICFVPRNPLCAYLAEAYGEIKILDMREGKKNVSHQLHERRINTIDFNPQRTHLMATSSTDGTVRVWDIRNIRGGESSLFTIKHDRAAHSAYFSPSGNMLATCSYDNNVGLLDGFLQEERQGAGDDGPDMISHYNQTNRWISSFRAIWGWDDRHIYIASMNRSIDVISTSSKTVSSGLISSFMTAIPCRLATHPLLEGILAGGTGGGQVYLWRK